MASFINTNINSLNSQRNLSMNQASLGTSMQRLSSGLRINSAKDDAAGLAIAERFTAQIKGANQAGRNANDAISLAQTGEGALSTASTILQRVRELAVQSANATNTAADRKALNTEAGSLLSELDRIATSTQFNGKNLLDGSNSAATFQVGANANQTITATTTNFRTSVYGAQLAQSTSVPSAATATSLAGTVEVNGQTTSTVTLTTADNAATAASKFNAVSDSTGVTATARTLAEFKVGTVGAGASYSLTVTGDKATNITFSVSANTSDGLAEALKAFNGATQTTGISAKLNTAGDGLILTHDSGADIKIANNSVVANTVTLAAYDAKTSATSGVATFTAATTGTGPSAGAAVARGNVEFSSANGFSFGASSSALVTTSDTSSLEAVSTIDISTVDGATKALKIVDGAMSAVSTQRANFGALQSRFEQTVNNLASTSENMTASRSRIQDADFASETANLSRAQVLQQAGTAMVAQANQLPQGVLALLR